MSIRHADWLKGIDATVGAILCRLMGRLFFVVKSGGVFRSVTPDTVKRILVIRPGGMGDMILLLPLIRSLQQAFAGARLDIVCEKRNMEVLEIVGLADCALVYDSHPLRFLRRIWQGSYDLAIDTEQFHYFSAIFAGLSRAPVRIGFKINPPRNPIYTHLINYAPDGPEGEQFLRLLEPLELRGQPCRVEGMLADRPLPDPATADPALAQMLASGPFVTLHPGAGAASKQWSPENYGRLIRQLHGLRLHPFGFVLVGGKEDAAAYQRIEQAATEAGARILSCAGTLSLASTASLIRRGRLFVGGDSGLAHLAVALGRPTVVLFGPSDQRKWGFENHSHAIVRRNIPCAPCFIFGYSKPCRTAECMAQIKVEDVLAQCRNVLQMTP